MQNRNIVAGSTICGALALIVGMVAIPWSAGLSAVDIDPKLERACHRAIERRAPLGHQDIETSTYVETAPNHGVAEGRILARYTGDQWMTFYWACHVHPMSGRVKHSEVRRDSRAPLQSL